MLCSAWLPPAACWRKLNTWLGLLLVRQHPLVVSSALLCGVVSVNTVQ